jgi:MFS family permease
MGYRLRHKSVDHPTIAVGLVAGLAESLALIVKVFSGTLSDYRGKRKALAVCGYALGAFTKPLFALAPGVGMVLTARLLDRVGKGVRGHPAMRWWRRLRRRICEAQRSVYGTRWIPSAHSWVR